MRFPPFAKGGAFGNYLINPARPAADGLREDESAPPAPPVFWQVCGVGEASPFLP